MSRRVRLEGLLWSSSDELEEQVGYGAMCDVGITKRPHESEKESKKEKRSKKRKSLDKPKSAEAKGEEMAGDAAMCGVGITKRSDKPETESKKEKRSKKSRSLDRPKPVDAKGEEMADDGVMCGGGITKRPYKPDEMKMKDTAVDAGSKEDGVAMLPSGEGKRRKKRKKKMLPGVVDFFLSEELALYMLSESPFPAPLCRITDDHFGPDIDRRISALIKERKVIDANILQEYRTNGYVNDQPCMPGMRSSVV